VISVAVGWRPEHIRVTPSSQYTRQGIKVYLDSTSIHETCIGDLHWAEGTLQVEVQDGTKAFGTPCTQATRFISLLINRQP
jgi:predicted N-acyltransferase